MPSAHTEGLQESESQIRVSLKGSFLAGPRKTGEDPARAQADPGEPLPVPVLAQTANGLLDGTPSGCASRRVARRWRHRSKQVRKHTHTLSVQQTVAVAALIVSVLFIHSLSCVCPLPYRCRRLLLLRLFCCLFARPLRSL